jgi:hypothetical protein
MPTYRTFFKILLLCLFFVGTEACSIQVKEHDDAPFPGSLSEEARKAYRNGQIVLLFTFRESIRDSEAYADWAAYLNDFKSGDGASFYIAEVSGKDWQLLGIEEKEFSLFFKKGYPSYIYEGLILEPQVYMAVDKRYSDQTLSDMDNAFLPDELEWLEKID